MLHYTLSQKNYNKLCGLAFRIADNNYMIERYGRENTEIERGENHKTICMLFNELDAAGVPFWVQNNSIAFGENWRRYKTEHLYNWLRARGVDVSGVSCI